MKKQKTYFENEYAEISETLSYLLEKAKEEGLKEIELIEAIPNTTNNHLVWCSLVEMIGDKSECNKSNCLEYLAPEKGKICQYRGRLMEEGEVVKFNVETGKQIN